MTSSHHAHSNEVPKLRVHHLLCIPLYQGYGYSGPFCENMSAVIQWLEDHAEEELELVCGPDMICAGCPNLTPDQRCKSSKSNVDEKDRKLAEAFGLEPHQRYSYRRLQEVAQDKLTDQIFVDSCKRCRWYTQGLCSYEEWAQAYVDR